MAKQRYIKTSFWSDNYIESLEPLERYLFLHLLTNDQTNITGIYQITVKRISFDTGLEKKEVEKILQKLSDDKKVFYIDGYIVIKNHLKNQSLNPSTISGAKREIEAIPQSVIEKIQLVYSLYTACSTLLNLTLPYLTSLNSNESKATKVANTPKKLKKEIIIDDIEQEKENSPPLVPPPPSPTRADLDELIQTLKTTADKLQIAYDKTRDRQFAKHLMDAFEYGEFAQKLGKTRIELAVSVMKASAQISYWKGIAGGPMSIYQNYSEIYNQRVSKTQKQQEKSKPIIYSPVL